MRIFFALEDGRRGSGAAELLGITAAASGRGVGGGVEGGERLAYLPQHEPGRRHGLAVEDDGGSSGDGRLGGGVALRLLEGGH